MIIASIIILGTIGLLFGFILSYIAKRFTVEKDQRVEDILNVLPGGNCGGCGSVNCRVFAKDLIAGKHSISDCISRSMETAKKIADILGEEVEDVQPMVAQLFCRGGTNYAKDRFNYHGATNSCSSAALIANGYKDCVYGCLNFGDCMEACPFDAIVMNEHGLPQIDKKKCVGCGNCVRACPRGIILLVPANAKVHVRCSSKDPARVVNKVCEVGCIGCKRCLKVCEYNAIVFDEGTNLAKIDYDKCAECGACVEVCPKNVIVFEDETPVNKEEKAA